MIEKLFIQLCELVIAISAFGGIIILIMATWHDLRQISRKKYLDTLAQRLPLSRQPAIAVLLYTENNEDTIITSLNSVQNADYENYQIIVIDNASSDSTRYALSKYQKTHPRVPMQTYKRRESVDRLSVLRLGYKKTKGSELVLILDATDILPADTMKHSAAHFIADEQLSLLRLRPYVLFTYNIRTIVGTFISLGNNLINKAISIRTSSLSVPLRSGTIMRSAAFLSEHLRQRPVTLYASTLAYFSSRRSSVYLSSRVSASIGKLLLTLVACLIAITMMTYFFYTAATLQSSTLLTISWFMTCIWLLAITWSDEATKANTKVELSIAIPFMYFVFYAYMIIAIFITGIQLVKSLPVQAINITSLQSALHAELYSTRY